MIKNHWPFLTILILSLFVVWPTFLPGYFFHHDDLHVLRIYEMRRCFIDYQIPCRWVPDMGFGNGYPLFNYYSALPYYIGAILSFPLGFVDSAKALFFIPLVLGGVAMFFLGKQLFGRLGGIVSAVLYLFAPYRALDAYVRGAIAESFALAIVPLVFYFSLRLFKKVSKFNFLGLSVSAGAFLLSHNIMTMIFLPLLLVWIIFWAPKFWKNISSVLLSLALGIGLSTFFIIPAFLEKDLVQSENLIKGGFQYWIHFVTSYQLFLDRSWQYGSSGFGPIDTISFQIGWPHWWVALAVVGFFIIRFYKSKFKFFDGNFKLGLLMIGFFIWGVFMAHNKSTFIWQSFTILQYAQFPWRFLGIVIFSASILGGLLVALLKNQWRLPIGLMIIALTIIFNVAYFKPISFYSDATDKKKLSGDSWEFQRKASILDYIPKTAQEPLGPAPSAPEVRTGKAEVTGFVNKSNKWQFQTNVLYKANIEIPVFDFPNWEVYANGIKLNHSHNNPLGRIRLDLEPGNYKVEGKFRNTPIRTLSNIITLTSLLIVIIYALGRKKYGS